MSGELKALIFISELTNLGVFHSIIVTGPSNLDDDLSEDTAMDDFRHFVRLEEVGSCKGQSLGLYFFAVTMMPVSTTTAD